MAFLECFFGYYFIGLENLCCMIDKFVMLKGFMNFVFYCIIYRFLEIDGYLGKDLWISDIFYLILGYYIVGYSRKRIYEK